MEVEHRETLEEEATHATDEARMVLPGIQAILGFQLIAVFNQRFQDLSEGLQVLHLAAFLLLAVAMGLVMAPAAYHRQAERGCITRRFVDFTSRLLSLSLVPLTPSFGCPSRGRHCPADAHRAAPFSSTPVAQSAHPRTSPGWRLRDGNCARHGYRRNPLRLFS